MEVLLYQYIIDAQACLEHVTIPLISSDVEGKELSSESPHCASSPHTGRVNLALFNESNFGILIVEPSSILQTSIPEILQT